MPTKVLVACAYATHLAQRASNFGVTIDGAVGVDMKRVWARPNAVTQHARSGLEGWLASTANCTVYRGHARFEARDRLVSDISLLEAHASTQLTQATRLAALTGLRKGDLLRLTWTHIGRLAIEMPTGKSSQRKVTLIPIYAELRALLESIPRTATRCC